MAPPIYHSKCMNVTPIYAADSSGILGIHLRVTKGLSPTKHVAVLPKVPFFASRTVPRVLKIAPVAAILRPRTRAFTPVNQPNAEGLKSCDYRR